MVGRQPGQDVVVGPQGHGVADHGDLVHDVAVTEHHAARGAGGARGVLQDGQVVGAHGRRLEGRRVQFAVAGDPREVGQVGLAREHGLDQPHEAGRGQDEGRTAVGDDLTEGRERALRVHRIRRIGRHGDQTGARARQHRDDEVQAGHELQQHALSGAGPGQKMGCQPAGPSLQQGPGQGGRRTIALAGLQIAERQFVAPLFRLVEERLDDGRNGEGSGHGQILTGEGGRTRQRRGDVDVGSVERRHRRRAGVGQCAT